MQRGVTSRLAVVGAQSGSLWQNTLQTLKPRGLSTPV
jgi:hypothetical protein